LGDGDIDLCFQTIDHMNYFLAADIVLLLGTIFLIRVLVLRAAKDHLIIAPVLLSRKNKHKNNRFYTDYFYTMGTIYTFLCGLFLLFNCIEISQIWGVFTMPDAFLIGQFLLDHQIYCYFLAFVGFVIAFVILPNRTRKLQEAQMAFISFSLIWPCLIFLGISLRI
jgi:hypothetical protein